MCELNGDVLFFIFPFFFLIFVFVPFSLKKKFYFVVHFTFLVTKTKIRNRKAVFQADSPIKGSRDLAW